MPTIPFEQDQREREVWGDDTMAVYKSDRHTGLGTGALTGWRFDVDYDDSTPNPDGIVCNRLCTDGTVCRLPRGHYPDSPHMRFDALLVVETGVYVLACHPPGTVTT